VTDGAGNPIPACDDGSGNQICNHGVHVTGIAAGEDSPANPQGFSGVAPAAFIIAIQVFTRFTCPNPAGRPTPCLLTSLMDQMNALDYVNTTLVPVWDIAAINMSIGGDPSNVACDAPTRRRPPHALKVPIDALLANGVATVISSGNNGWTDTITGPGCISTAVTVGAVIDAHVVIFNMGNLVDILAPGQGVVSSVPDNTFGSMSGTSMAAPHVTGAFAVIRSIVGTSMSVADILQLLQNTGELITDARAANNPDGFGSGTLTGYVKPRLQLDAAVAELLPADLRLVKICTPDDSLPTGQNATCTIFVDNLGPAPAINVTLVDDYLSNGSFRIRSVRVSDGSCTRTANPQVLAGSSTCDLGTMAAGARIAMTVTISANTAQDVNNVATVRSDTVDPNFENNIATDGVAFRPPTTLMAGSNKP
jgi:uncharacterized repeat protein (TIGR01451 family)